MHCPNYELWLSDLANNKTDPEKNKNYTESNGEKNDGHKITRQNKTHRNKTKDESNRHPEIHSPAKMEMGRTHFKKRGHQVDEKMHGVETKNRKKSKGKARMKMER